MTDDTVIDDELRALCTPEPMESESIAPKQSPVMKTSRPSRTLPTPKPSISLSKLPKLRLDSFENPLEDFENMVAREQDAPYLANSRLMRANVNYIDFYNRFIREALDGYTLRDKRNIITSSTVTHDHKMYYKRFADRPGTIWSYREKEIFFRALATCSIHRADMIHDQIPTKSIPEILTYYDALKKELNRRKYKHNKVRICKYKLGKKKIIKLPKIPKDLLRYDELPIAYEMSESFIRLEEEQSDALGFKGRAKDNDATRHFKKMYDHYTDVAQVHLFDMDNLRDLSRSIYFNSNWTGYFWGFPPSLDLKPLVFLEDLVVNVTKKILLRTVEKALLDRKDHYKIEKSHIRTAASELGYRNNNEMFNWNLYWAQIQERLNVDVIDDVSSNRIMTPEESKRYILSHSGYNINLKPWVKRMTKWDCLPPGYEIEDPFLSKSKDEPSEVGDIDEQGEDIVHISTLMKQQNDERQQKNTAHLSSGNSEVFEMITDHLNQLEEETLEARDSSESRVHERGLLTYFLTTNKEHNHDKLYHGTDEAEKVLEFWDLEDEARREWDDYMKHYKIEKQIRYEQMRAKGFEKSSKRRGENEGENSDDSGSDVEEEEEEEENDDDEYSGWNGQASENEESDSVVGEGEEDLDMESQGSSEESDSYAEDEEDEDEEEESDEPELFLSKALVDHFQYAFTDYSHDDTYEDPTN